MFPTPVLVYKSPARDSRLGPGQGWVRGARPPPDVLSQERKEVKAVAGVRHSDIDEKQAVEDGSDHGELKLSHQTLQEY